MSVVFILVFAAIILASVFLVAFIWSVKNGQYEDTYTPSVRMLFDDPEIKEGEKVAVISHSWQKKKKRRVTVSKSQLAEKKKK